MSVTLTSWPDGCPLLGLRVTRSKSMAGPGTSHQVWCGVTKFQVAQHAEFIRTKCYDPEVDGELTLEPIEAPVVITRPGLYAWHQGALFVKVERIYEDGTAFGRMHRRHPKKKGQWQVGAYVHLYVNGQAYGHTKGHVTALTEAQLGDYQRQVTEGSVTHYAGEEE